MVKAEKQRKLRISDACLCGSGKTIGRCCYDPIGGILRRPLPSLVPPGPRTGYSHSGCYLRATADCSEQLSREHYMSASVLRELGVVIRVKGMSWQEVGTTLETTLGNLTAKILCKRHNEALSPLDDEAGRFFRILRSVLTDLERRTISRKRLYHLVSGEVLELWMLKVACGLYFGPGSVNRVRMQETCSIDMAKVVAALFSRRWDPRAGMYLQAAVGNSINVEPGIAAAPLISATRLAGAMISFDGFFLDVAFDTSGAIDEAFAGRVYHPTELDLRQRRRRHSIVLTWPPGTPPRSVKINHLRSSEHPQRD